MSDSFVMDMDEVEDNSFDLMPTGWYKAVVSGWSEEINGNEIVVKKADGKLPQGTRGTSWEFTFIETDKFDGRKIWTTYWHHANTASFWKQLYKATDVQGTSGTVDLLELRDDALGEEVWLQVGVQKSPGYDPRNNVKGIKHLSEREDPNDASSDEDPLDFED